MAFEYQERLGEVEELVKDRRSDIGKRTGVPFIVYTYPPEEELKVDEEIRNLIGNLEYNGQTVEAIDLRDLVFSILEDEKILDAVIDQERRDKAKLLEGLKSSLLYGSSGPGKLASRILERAEGADTVVIYRMGILYPFASGSTLMGQLEGQVPADADDNDIPIVLCYPATTDENTLHFLNESDGTYYRAKVI
jgi:hypothetical protein